MEAILTAVCQYLEINKKEVISKCRDRNLVTARMYFYFFATKLNSLSDVGRFLNRQHATVINGLNRVNGYLQYDAQVMHDLEMINLRLEGYNELVIEKLNLLELCSQN